MSIEPVAPGPHVSSLIPIGVIGGGGHGVETTSKVELGLVDINTESITQLTPGICGNDISVPTP